MILNTNKEKIEFLNGLFNEINRIYRQNLTPSDHEYFSSKKGAQCYTLSLSEESSSLDEKLPRNLTLNKYGYYLNQFTVKHAKLRLLIDLYNRVQEASQPEGALDLTDIFAKFKTEHEDIRVTYDRYKSAEETLKYQRRHSQRESVSYFARMLNYIFGEPKSAKFLTKYDFFGSSSSIKSPSESNIDPSGTEKQTKSP